MLQDFRFQKIAVGEFETSKFDSLIQAANARIEEIKQALLDHVQSHGCGKDIIQTEHATEPLLSGKRLRTRRRGLYDSGPAAIVVEGLSG